MERETKRGRPPKFATGERTRGPLTIRLRDQVRQELETAAAAAGRSLSEEIEYRLELSFSRRDYLHETWGDDFFNLADAAAKSLAHIERFTGKTWVEDERTGKLLEKVLAELVVRYRHQVAVTQMFGLEHQPQKSDPELVNTFVTLSGLASPSVLLDSIGKSDTENSK
jgi:hypothetical protein